MPKPLTQRLMAVARYPASLQRAPPPLANPVIHSRGTRRGPRGPSRSPARRCIKAQQRPGSLGAGQGARCNLRDHRQLPTRPGNLHGVTPPKNLDKAVRGVTMELGKKKIEGAREQDSPGIWPAAMMSIVASHSAAVLAGV